MWYLCAVCLTIVVALIIFTRLLSPGLDDLSDDLMLITGSAHGIGRLVTILMARYCKRIIAVDKNVNALREIASIVKKRHNVTLILYECDLCDPFAIQNVAADIRENHGRVTILISNAGIVNGNYLIDASPSKVEKVFRVNTIAPFYLIKEFLPGMLGSAFKSATDRIPKVLRLQPQPEDLEKCNTSVPPNGRLVFVSSIAGQTVGCGLADYCASKAGLCALADTLRVEISAMGMDKYISVTDIRPFAINTGMFDGFSSKLPMLREEMVAERIVRAVIRRERTVYIPRYMWFLPIIQRVLPYPVLFFCLKISGAVDGMSTFRHANRNHI